MNSNVKVLEITANSGNQENLQEELVFDQNLEGQEEFGLFIFFFLEETQWIDEKVHLSLTPSVLTQTLSDT